jgi:hypothetical protein
MNHKNLSKTKPKHLRGLEQNTKRKHENSELGWIINEASSVFGKLVCYRIDVFYQLQI